MPALVKIIDVRRVVKSIAPSVIRKALKGLSEAYESGWKQSAHIEIHMDDMARYMCHGIMVGTIVSANSKASNDQDILTLGGIEVRINNDIKPGYLWVICEEQPRARV